ncbi:disulfide isomerase DsbC N-terminal domain-containing protein [Vibrio cyclitrophicus]
MSIEASPIDGLYQALIDRGLLYVSPDGSKLLHGIMYDLQKGMKNLTEAKNSRPSH